uniref:Uncharacterized protein n=1 Tax=Trieres chinensis TaxID=1514140 RepID=A0A7S1ZQ05_TRICV|mmetsp:Transcript_30316/g.61830  ORF Transcript_30316/g.61830 Transcript_30316/m.61830 type:complete len:137 (+) Transcript_30316:107-517(+)
MRSFDTTPSPFIASSPSTPTYSADRARLAQSHPNGCIVSSYDEAKGVVLSWGVTKPHSPLHRRVRLNTDEDWRGFLDSCGKSTADHDDTVQIDLERVLKRCYEVAFYMPPSPSASMRLSPAHVVGAGRDSPTPLLI